MTNTKENVRLANGYMAFDYQQYYYNDYNVKGNNPDCKHPTFTDKSGVTMRQPYFNRYCDTCGYRKLFTMYAKFVKKGRR